MIAVTCPPRERLATYVQGRLDLAPHEAVEAHLDDCFTCRSLVEHLDCGLSIRLDARDTPLPNLPTDEDDFRRLVERVKSIVPGMQSSTSLVRGTILGNYELLDPIGAGGMGCVYKAHHRRMNRFVAVKVLSPELLRSADARARFQREVEAAARVTSPNVAAAYDAGEANGRDFLVMEYIEGSNLANFVKQGGPLPVERALDYVLQAARGLVHAHAAGLVHRDVKPANLLLDHNGTVKVLDLGLARALIGNDGTGSQLTATSTAMGTPSFMAPEQAADARAADVRADVYGLGCTLHYLLSGRPPFEGATALEVVLGHREKPVPTIAGCSSQITTFLRKAMAKRPTDRFATMSAVVAELECLLGRGGSALPRRGTFSWRWSAAAAILLSAGAITWAFVVFNVPKSAPERVMAIADNPTATALEIGRAGTPATVSIDPQTPIQLERRKPRWPRVESFFDHADGLGRRTLSAVQFAAVSALPHSPSIDMVAIKPGKFFMGSAEPDAPADEKPRAAIEFTYRFELGKFEVTQEEYEAVMGTNPSFFSSKTSLQLKGQDTRRHPVESVSWLDAIRFCNRLSERHGLMPYYQIDGERVTRRQGPGYRLPTEAEWEYACRAGTTTRWFFGDDVKQLGDFAWFAGNSEKKTHPVGLKKANEWGLHDMLGNVPEWCWDHYRADALRTVPEFDPPGQGDGTTRVTRGGAWNARADQTRSATRHSLGMAYSAELSPNHIGFRVARDLTD